jgi:uncharacterized protein with LGFP repeats
MGRKSLSSKRIRETYARVVAVTGAVLMLTSVLVAFQAPSAADAVNASSFDPGNIISDAQFYDSNAMSEAQIQSFLTARNSGLKNYRDSVASRTRVVSDSTGNVRCGAFTGGSNLLASTIIYRAQIACGISAKVILVTLQKEQGLINKSSASTAALDRAMGYACPDTAPCAEYALGFGNQVYMGVLQLNTYKAARFGMQPGVNRILWHPNAACGASSVNVRNYATAALYNYTPYRPNAAALNSYPGTGDFCSSYGNRNFWFQYHAWFGNPVTIDGAFEIREAYAASGGAAGPLGAEAKTLVCAVGTTRCWHEYVNGYITWTHAGGTVVVSGVIADRYREIGGPTGSLGYALSPVTSFEVAGNGNGEAQAFSGGYLYSSAAGTYRVKAGTQLESAWIAQGWIRGELGWPTADLTCIASGACSQEFQHGALVASPDGAVVEGAIADAYFARGGYSGSLGYPVGRADTFATPNGTGSVQVFQGGYLYSSVAGVFKVQPGTPIANAWNAAGWIRGSLGWPVGEATCDGSTCTQQFQHGTLYASPSGTGAVTDPKIAAAYAAAGGPSGALGYPISVTSEFSTPNGTGSVQTFQGGYLYSSAAGVFKVTPGSAVSDAWNASGWIRGSLGWPAGEMACNGVNCSQQFQHGTLYTGSGVAGAVTDPAIAAAYASAGGPGGSLGYPTSVTTQWSTVNGAGAVQTFQSGYLYSSAAGVFKVTPGSAISDAWNASGWIRGSLGWPAGEMACADGSCTQQFQHGTLTKRS